MHPAALTDGKAAVVITARRLRATHQYTAKRIAEIQAKQRGKKQHAGRWKQVQARKNRFLAQQKQRAQDIEHKVARAVVDWAKERGAGTLAIGDVRDVADGKRLGAKSQQKIARGSHGKTRQYITYTAQGEGITVELVDERNTSKTCPACGHQDKPRGRVYRVSLPGVWACGAPGRGGQRQYLVAEGAWRAGEHPAASVARDDVSFPCLAGKA
jgi:putative transposase